MAVEEASNMNGIRFACLRCGRCCRDPGEESYVFLRQGDLERLCDFLSMMARDFAASFLVAVEGLLCLAGYDGDCIFLDEEKGCRVYAARPLQCRTWPFWPQNMETPAAWADTKARCPGVGRGSLVETDDIQALLEEMGRTPYLENGDHPTPSHP